MSWLTKKHHKGRQDRVPRARESSEPEPMPYRMPTDAEIEQKLRDMEEVNRMIAGNAPLQAAIAQVTEQQLSPPPPSLEELRDRARSGGLSYIAGPPADLEKVCPEAARLHAEGAMLGVLTGDETASLAKFEEALALVRAVGHERAEARLLYNIGLAHYKLGDHLRAIEVLADGMKLASQISDDLAREARKLQRFEEERKLDDPQVKVIGTPGIEQKLLAMFIEALATVYEAAGLPTQAATLRAELERLYGEAGR